MHRRRPRLQHLPRPHQHPALRHPASHPAAGSTGHYHRTRLRACLLQALQLRCKEPLILWDPPGFRHTGNSWSHIANYPTKQVQAPVHAAGSVHTSHF